MAGVEDLLACVEPDRSNGYRNGHVWSVVSYLPCMAAIVVTCADTEVKVSSPERLVFPPQGDAAALTKLDVVAYYVAVADRMIAQVMQRPTALERWPNGVFPDGGSERGESFFTKHLPAKGTPDWVHGVKVTFPSGRNGVELMPDHPAVLVWAAQMGAITFHPWPVTAPDVDHPDTLRLDFDPAGTTGFSDAVEAALMARELLVSWGWASWCKTSGGRGVHVHIPIEPRWGFVDVRHVAIAIGRELERRAPELITMSWWKEERGDRVFVDFNQTAQDRTMAAAYSIRANEHATVSMPVSWTDLASVRTVDFTVRTVPELLREPDPWADLMGSAVVLNRGLEQWQADVDAGLGELPYPPDFPKMPGEPPRVQPSRRKH